MSMPKFSADAALYEKGVQYRTPATYAARASTATILPQQTNWGHVSGGIGYCDWLCKSDPNCINWCTSTVLGGLFPDGLGGSGGTFDPGVNCGPCRHGRQRCWVPGYGAGIFPCEL